ncbi:MAG: hypothetical protein EPO26_02310 [Chloroflexota bacterium]|nr:MAG: hypothetical protein EPO26_02310 [Chloroflexota bacterium]
MRVEGTPIDSYLSKIAEVDERSGRPLSRQVFLSEAPGGGADRNGVVVQPGESVLLIAAYGDSPDRFYAVRSFDGLRRGWLAESALAPQSRPR